MFGRRTPDPVSTVTESSPSPELDAEARLDERLIQNAQRGDLPSFNTVVARHERVVFALCLRMLRDPALAEDATQDTFLKAWSAVGSFTGGMVRPWLLRIASNRCLDMLRAQTRRPATSLESELVEVEPTWTSGAAAEEQPEHFAGRQELSGLLERALGLLPEDQRLAVLLADVHGYPYEEVAAMTGVAVGTVKSRISRARARLRDILLADAAGREHLERFGRQD